MVIVNEPESIVGKKVIQDPNEIAQALRRGETVYHWEAGDSMSPMLRHMEYCKIVPIFNDEIIEPGAAVFCKMKDPVNGNEFYMVHQVWQKANFGHDGKTWYKIGSTMGTIFGWSCEILGKAYGTDIFQEVTPEIRASWEEEWRRESEMREAGEA